jgi:hypothetical protein
MADWLNYGAHEGACYDAYLDVIAEIRQELEDEDLDNEPCCEECSNELSDYDYGCYETHCEKCYTKLFHPKIWAEQQAKLDYDNDCEDEEEDEEDD